MANPELEAAIAQYGIPKWPYQAAYDRVIVFSLPEEKATRETYVPGGLVVKPQTRTEREVNETPRGILVSAGLQAQDVLRSHGMGLGHVVWVARLSPWRHEIDRDQDGKIIEFLFLRVGDIVGSETLYKQIVGGSVRAVEIGGSHVYEFDGIERPRFDPPSYVA